MFAQVATKARLVVSSKTSRGILFIRPRRSTQVAATPVEPAQQRSQSVQEPAQKVKPAFYVPDDYARRVDVDALTAAVRWGGVMCAVPLWLLYVTASG